MGPAYPPCNLAQLCRNQLRGALLPSDLGSHHGPGPSSSTAGVLIGLSKALMGLQGFLIQIFCLLLTACILQSNSTRGLQSHQAAARTVVTALTALFFFFFPFPSGALQCQQAQRIHEAWWATGRPPPRNTPEVSSALSISKLLRRWRVTTCLSGMHLFLPSLANRWYRE